MASLIDFFFRPLFSGLERTPDRPAPLARNIIQDPKQTLALPAFLERLRQTNVVKPFLQTQIKEAQGFLKRTFFQNPNIGETAFQRRQRINRIPRNIRFQPLPKGSTFGINPFTGLRIPLPVGPRGSSVTEAFFGGKRQLQFNQNLISQGLFIQNSVQKFISDIQARIKIIDTNSV